MFLSSPACATIDGRDGLPNPSPDFKEADMPRLGETTMVLTETEMGILHSYLLNTEDEHMVNVSQMLRDISKAENWRKVVNRYITNWRSSDVPTMPKIVEGSLRISLDTESTFIQALRDELAKSLVKEEQAIKELNACVLESAYTRELLHMKLTGQPTEK